MRMKLMNYWAVFQMLLGIWLLISPFAFGFTELTHAALNSMIVGAVVAVTGLGSFLFEIYHRREICKLEEMEGRAS
jgi:membrane protein YdbS with pleckstrin-like domain